MTLRCMARQAQSTIWFCLIQKMSIPVSTANSSEGAYWFMPGRVEHCRIVAGIGGHSSDCHAKSLISHAAANADEGRRKDNPHILGRRQQIRDQQRSLELHIRTIRAEIPSREPRHTSSTGTSISKPKESPVPSVRLREPNFGVREGSRCFVGRDGYAHA
jgi:hypothetical protein